jgi:hypothetical protein
MEGIPATSMAGNTEETRTMTKSPRTAYTRTVNVVWYVLLIATLGAIGVGLFWNQPRFSPTEAAAKHLPAVPLSAITAWKRCEDQKFKESQPHPEQICEPIVVAEDQKVKVLLEPVRSLHGYWRGTNARFAWTHGRIPATTHSDSWGSSIVGVGGIPTVTVNPYINVVIPNIGDNELHKPIAATAKLSVTYPAKTGGGFSNVTEQRTRQLHVVVVSTHEMQLLSEHTQRPRTARERIIAVLIVVDILGVLVLIVMGVIHRRRTRKAIAPRDLKIVD